MMRAGVAWSINRVGATLRVVGPTFVLRNQGIGETTNVMIVGWNGSKTRRAKSKFWEKREMPLKSRS